MQAIAVFDFDGTIIPGDSVVRLICRARARGAATWGELLCAALRGALYSLRLMDETRAKAPTHAFLTRMEAEPREAFLRDFARDLVSRARPAALAEMAARRRAGDLILLCSASCACYMRYVADALGADALICTDSAPDGRMLPPNCRAAEKARRVRAWLADNGYPPQALAAGYGDSAGDAHILSLCVSPVLVNPRRALVRLMPGARRVRW